MTTTNFRARRDMMADFDDKTKAEVSSDGRTVWVNKAFLVARFSSAGQEFFAAAARVADGVVVKSRQHPEKGPTESDWEDFVTEVATRFQITINPARHKPMYLGGPR